MALGHEGTVPGGLGEIGLGLGAERGDFDDLDHVGGPAGGLELLGEKCADLGRAELAALDVEAGLDGLVDVLRHPGGVGLAWDVDSEQKLQKNELFRLADLLRPKEVLLEQVTRIGLYTKADRPHEPAELPEVEDVALELLDAPVVERVERQVAGSVGVFPSSFRQLAHVL